MIRKNKKSDLKWIHYLVRHELIPITQQTFPQVQYNRGQVNKRLRRGATYVFCNAKHAAPQGFIHTKINGRITFIDMLVVYKQARNTGIGSELIAKAVQIARRNQCTSIQLYVDAINSKAQQFYFKHGFYVEHYDRTIHCFLMTRRLTPSYISKSS